MADTKKKAPAVREHQSRGLTEIPAQGNDRKKDLMTTMTETTDTAQSLVVVPCEHPGCDRYSTGHQVDALDRDCVMHLHAGPWEKAPGSVDCYFDADLGRWHVGAALDDSDRPLTCDEVHEFTRAWDEAYATAQDLNATEVPC